MTTDSGAGVPLTFLGTGNAFAGAGYWSSFLVGGRVLMETSPAVLANLRRMNADMGAIDAIFLSHFHADHTFGWPFLLLEYLARTRRSSDLWVVGPPGVGERLEQMCRVGAYPLHDRARGGFDLHFVEANPAAGWQEAGPVPFRAELVEHAADLECFGFVVEQGGRRIGYSGDTGLCNGLRALVRGSDAMVMECNAQHSVQAGHMVMDDVRTLRAEFPDRPFVLTHAGKDVDPSGIPGVHRPRDFETVTV